LLRSTNWAESPVTAGQAVRESLPLRSVSRFPPWHREAVKPEAAVAARQVVHISLKRVRFDATAVRLLPTTCRSILPRLLALVGHGPESRWLTFVAAAACRFHKLDLARGNDMLASLLPSLFVIPGFEGQFALDIKDRSLLGLLEIRHRAPFVIGLLEGLDINPTGVFIVDPIAGRLGF